MHWNCCIKTSCESGVGRFGGWLAAVGFLEARLRLKHGRWSGMAKECRLGKMLQFSGKEGLLETRTALQSILPFIQFIRYVLYFFRLGC